MLGASAARSSAVVRVVEPPERTSEQTVRVKCSGVLSSDVPAPRDGAPAPPASSASVEVVLDLHRDSAAELREGSVLHLELVGAAAAREARGDTAAPPALPQQHELHMRGFVLSWSLPALQMLVSFGGLLLQVRVCSRSAERVGTDAAPDGDYPFPFDAPVALESPFHLFATVDRAPFAA